MDLLPDTIPEPLDLLARDLERARGLGEANGGPGRGYGCLATVDAEGRSHARMVTFRVLDRTRLQFWAFRTSPKVRQLETGRGYELNVWWAAVRRQYRLQGTAEWVPAERIPAEYAAVPFRARVWDHLHEELPQSGVLDDREALVRRYEATARDLERRFGSPEAVPPSPGAGAVHLSVSRVEIEQIDLDRRLHDRRLLALHDGAWSQVRLVP